MGRRDATGLSVGWECALLSVASCALFWGMAVVAEYRFVPTLNVVARRLRIPKNVAGATLMAVGASCPELFSNVISMFVTRTDLGIGTIIGSEIFNHMIILAGICWARPEAQRLDRLASYRDCLAYGVALALLLVSLRDVRRQGFNHDDHLDDNSKVVVHYYSPVPLLLWYGAYVYLCSRAGRAALARCCGVAETRHADSDDDDDDGDAAVDKRDDVEALLRGDDDAADAVVEALLVTTGDPDAPLAKVYGAAEPFRATARPAALFRVPDVVAATPWELGRGLLDLAVLPLGYLLDKTLLEPSDALDAAGLAWNMVGCVLWLIAFSYGMVVSLERIGDAVGLSAAVMGLTVGAIGTSFPNLVASMVAARDGAASMAVANALGSNVFNLCVCIGLPWLAYPAVTGDNYDLMHDYAIVVNTGLLAAVLLGYVGLLAAANYTLTPVMGWAFAAIYVAFLVAALVAGKQTNNLENRIQGGH